MVKRQTGILTPRETEVLELTARGMTGKLVGNQLFIAEQTVKNHLYSARCKLGATNTHHAIYLMCLPHLVVTKDSTFVQ